MRGRVTGAAALLAVVACGVAGLAAIAHAGPGDIDLGFGDDGRRTIDYGGFDEARDVALRPDGRIVVVGTGNAGADVAIQALLPDGRGDPSLNGGGSLGIPLDGTDVGEAVAIQPDGKILVAGWTRAQGAQHDLFVLRTNADGSPDTGFGDGGRRIIDYLGDDRALDIALRPDGRIVVVGTGNAARDVAIQALLPDGRGDPSLNGGGSLGIPLAGNESGEAVAIQPDGKILVAGWTRQAILSPKPFVLRVNPDGSPDSSFSDDGIRVFDHAGQARDIALRPDGRIVIVGTGTANDDVVVQALLPDGRADPSLNDGDLLAIPLVGADYGFGVALQPDGKIVVAAAGGAAKGSGDFVVLRIQPGGALDGTYRGGGSRTVDFAPPAAANAIALQPDGRILAAGGAGGNVAIARLQGDPRPVGGAAGAATVGGAPRAGARGGSRAPRCDGRAATIVGTAARDRLQGTPRADVIVALGGADAIRGAGGRDLICAGAGNDAVAGGAGADVLLGGPGRDRLLGGPGDDRIAGGAGADRLLGGAGRDRCAGGRRMACER